MTSDNETTSNMSLQQQIDHLTQVVADQAAQIKQLKDVIRNQAAQIQTLENQDDKKIIKELRDEIAKLKLQLNRQKQYESLFSCRMQHTFSSHLIS